MPIPGLASQIPSQLVWEAARTMEFKKSGDKNVQPHLKTSALGLAPTATL